jgi:hypothetical protein
MKGFYRKKTGGAIAVLFLSVLLVSMPVDVTHAAGRSLDKAYLYILSSGKNGASGVNTLSIVDADSKTSKEMFRLEKGNVGTLNRDPYGRFWAGYSSPDGRRENRVQVFKPDGSFSKIIKTAGNPEAGFVFSRGRVFIACTQNGFSGAIDVFDQTTLKRIKTIKLSSKIKDTPYYLSAIAGDERRIIVAGMTSGPDKNLNYCIITVINPANLLIINQTDALAGVDIWCIIPHRGKFIMLNSAPAGKSDKNVSNMLVMGEHGKIDKTSFVQSPLIGVIKDNTLYAYHNPAFNSISTNPSRMLSAYNLRTGKYLSWKLPDRWNCSGIAAVEGRILMLNSEAPDKKARGIYAFSLKDNKLSLIMNIPAAKRMLFEK